MLSQANVMSSFYMNHVIKFVFLYILIINLKSARNLLYNASLSVLLHFHIREPSNFRLMFVTQVFILLKTKSKDEKEIQPKFEIRFLPKHFIDTSFNKKSTKRLVGWRLSDRS